MLLRRLSFLRWLAVAGLLLGASLAHADLPDVIARIKPSVVIVGTHRATDNPRFRLRGTGFVVGNGNLVVTFSAPIDQIVIDYGNHSLAPANPGQQAVAIHDITFCRPVAAISVTKLSTVISDPVNGTTFPKAIPGAVMEYCILVSNTGPAALTNLSAADTLPSNFNYATGSLKTGSNCATATTAEDDDNAGVDESDPFGAAIAGTAISASASSLGSGSSFALKFRGTVN